MALLRGSSTLCWSNTTAEHDAARVPKLARYCYDSLSKSPPDNQSLYKLSADELVELNGRLLKDYQGVKVELSQLKKYRYPVDPPRVQTRVGREMYERVEAVNGAWTPVSPAEVEGKDMCGLMDFSMGSKKPETDIVWDEATGQAVYEPRSFTRNSQELLAYKSIISSALLMYRLCCLFPCDVRVDGPEGYKLVWSIYLKHKGTNTYVGFSEWKGSPTFLMSETLLTGTAFDEDWLALLNLLLDPNCPHPYDGTVAGSVA